MMTRGLVNTNVAHPATEQTQTATTTTTSVPNVTFDDASSPVDVTSSSEGPSKGDATVRYALVQPELWLLFTALMGGLCFGVTLLNNLGGIVASVDSTARQSELRTDDQHLAFEQRVGALVVMFSSANVVGRLGVGQLAERFQDRIPRVAWMALGCAISAIGALVFVIVPSSAALWGVVPVGGFSLGLLFGSAPLATSDLFGFERFGSIWGIVVGAPCVTTILVATIAAGRMSDDHASSHYYFIKDHRFCLGAECYRGAIGISFGCAFCGAVAAVLLLKRAAA